MAQHVCVRSSSDNEQVTQPFGTKRSPCTDELDTTDDEFMQLVAQVHAEADTLFNEDPDPEQQGELT